MTDQIYQGGSEHRSDRWRREGMQTRWMEEGGVVDHIDGGGRERRPDRWRREGTQV